MNREHYRDNETAMSVLAVVEEIARSLRANPNRLDPVHAYCPPELDVQATARTLRRQLDADARRTLARLLTEAE